VKLDISRTGTPFLRSNSAGTAGRDDIDPLFLEGAREFRDPLLVGDGDESAGDFHGNVEAMKSLSV